VSLVLQTRLRQQIGEQRVRHVVAVQGKAVRPRVGLARLWDHHAIVRAHRVSQARTERLQEQAVIARDDAAPLVYIELSEWHLRLHLD